MSSPVTDLPAPVAIPPLDRRSALFLDIDGTLTEIVQDPRGVSFTPDLIAMLQRLGEHLDGALALISGRGIADIDALFAPHRFPAGGQHGLEWRFPGGAVEEKPIDHAALATMHEALTRFVAAHPGAILERKSLSLSLHFRRVPEVQDAARAAVEQAMARYGDAFHIQGGLLVYEIKPRGASKGSVIESFMKRAPFAGRHPVFAGDDLGDEPGFVSVNALGGTTIVVGARTPSAARHRLPSVAATWQWLADALGEPNPRKT